ncbi:putative ferric-chelate reductase 1 isoform X2 [Boleophthalmus pectinirostris]|nr:putative ferric-chelate reductase 1 isoform X2 [Boleophthalmus pectinirostris]
MRVWVWSVAVLVCVCWFDSSLCYPNGSVSISCESMIPVHLPYTANSSSPPYTLSASADTYRPGDSITVTLEVQDATLYFEGFFLQARSSSSPELWPVGKFKVINNNMFTSLTCNSKMNSAVSQANNTKRTKVVLTWEAPNNEKCGDVHFRATVVKSYSKFWLNVTSPSVKLERSPGAPPAVVSWSVLLFCSVSLLVHS